MATSGLASKVKGSVLDPCIVDVGRMNVIVMKTLRALYVVARGEGHMGEGSRCSENGEKEDGVLGHIEAGGCGFES